MRKIITLLLVFAIAVLSSGCMDSGTMNKYESYIQVYDNDIDEYNSVMNELIEKQDNYNTAYEEYVDASDSYSKTVSSGARIAMMYADVELSDKEDKLDVALNQLATAKNNYEFTANTIYSHLDEFEFFIISNEETLERNGVDTVQLKAEIQDWKEEIRYNLN
ncbi:hypothetical protein [Methanococcoides sp. NM1]|uniref:hypothetical protein n=1 Tax=Methanococcoides sp. NM1 TaxID=1201013 RepID=UPI0010836889|nr:hypothetical protein [Methanococcoides sp. NM1]